MFPIELTARDLPIKAMLPSLGGRQALRAAMRPRQDDERDKSQTALKCRLVVFRDAKRRLQMFESYWGLTESPFANRQDVRWFHESPVHEEALARLFYVIEQRRGLGLLTGGSGAGKSLLLKVIGHQVRRTRRHLAAVDLVGLDAHEMLWQIASVLQLAPNPNASRWGLWRSVADHIESLKLARQQLVFALDHVERADWSCHGLLERLFHFAEAKGSVTFLCAVRSNDYPKVARLLGEHADLRVELTPLAVEDTGEFIHDLVQKAGCERSVFGGDAILRLHSLSRGCPRTLCRLCELALIAGMAEERDVISEDLVDSVAEELAASSDGEEFVMPRHEYV